MKQVEIVKEPKQPNKKKAKEIPTGEIITKIVENETEISITQEKPIIKKNHVPPKIKKERLINKNVRNEQGIRLTKKGLPDKRSELGKERIIKVREALMRAKKAKQETITEVDSDTDDDTYEYEVKTEKIVEAKAEPAPPVSVPASVPEPMLEVEKLKEENAKLKSSYFFNEHLNKVSNLSRSMKLKF
jgi:beta-glucosidase-like glycosyl hydrolase